MKAKGQTMLHNCTFVPLITESLLLSQASLLYFLSGRMFDYHVLDMIELGVDKFQSMHDIEVSIVLDKMFIMGSLLLYAQSKILNLTGQTDYRKNTHYAFYNVPICCSFSTNLTVACYDCSIYESVILLE